MNSSVYQKKKQSGAVLIISLIMLMLMTLIGATALQTNSLEERMAGNLQDRTVALQAAESALRDAEGDINNVAKKPIPRITETTLPYFKKDCGKSTSSENDDGLCDPGRTKPSMWKTINLSPEIDGGKPSVAYGKFTGATPIQGLSAQPRYIIEVIRDNRDCSVPGKVGKNCYLVTARAQGANPNTVVTLQTVYIP